MTNPRQAVQISEILRLAEAIESPPVDPEAYPDVYALDVLHSMYKLRRALDASTKNLIIYANSKLGVSQRKLAQHAELSTQTVNRWVNTPDHFDEHGEVMPRATNYEDLLSQIDGEVFYEPPGQRERYEEQERPPEEG